MQSSPDAPRAAAAPAASPQRLADRVKAAARVSLLVAGLLVAPERAAEAQQQQRTAEMPLWAQKLGVAPDQISRATKTLDEVLRSPLVRAKAPNMVAQRDLLLALVVRESALRQGAVSSSNARGYFQMTPIALRQIERSFGLQREELDLSNPTTNMAAGILYLEWTHQQVQRLFPLERSPRGQMLLTLMGYNGGMKYLQTLRQPNDTYETFALRTGQLLHGAVGGEQRTALREVHPNYGVRYRALPGVKRYQDLRKHGRVRGDIHGNSVAIVGDGLEYGELIAGIASELHADTPAWLRGGTSIETVTKDRMLWSISREVTNQLAGRVHGFSQNQLRGDHRVREQWRVRVESVLLAHNGLRADQIGVGTRLEIPPLATFQRTLVVRTASR